MAVRWIPFAFCTEGGFVGWLIVFLCAYYKYAWFIIYGMAQTRPQLWLIYILIYGQFEELFFNQLIGDQFPQARPQCTLEYDEVFEHARSNAMPSLETELAFSLSVFVLGHYIINDGFPNYFFLTGIAALPWIVAGGLFATSNNTALQILVGAGLGSVNALKRLLLYHYFAKLGLMEWIQRLPFLRIFFPGSD